MARIVHIVPVRDEANGVWRLANLLASEDGGIVQIGCKGIRDADEVWVHGLWLPCEWYACWNALRLGKRLVRMTHGSLSPVYLAQQGKWKKWLVGPIERFFLRRAACLVATCEAEKDWIATYLRGRCPRIEVTDVKRFFKLEPLNTWNARNCGDDDPLHFLYLGRRHPLKGLEYLEDAVRQINNSTHSSVSSVYSVVNKIDLRIVSNVFDAEKEKVWDWCDVLVLPTLSENFGLVVAEALERGKRVITTDGAPAWGDDCLDERVESLGLEGKGQGKDPAQKTAGEIWSGYGGRLLYLKGYRHGSRGVRVKLLQQAVERVVSHG